MHRQQRIGGTLCQSSHILSENPDIRRDRDYSSQAQHRWSGAQSLAGEHKLPCVPRYTMDLRSPQRSTCETMQVAGSIFPEGLHRYRSVAFSFVFSSESAKRRGSPELRACGSIRRPAIWISHHKRKRAACPYFHGSGDDGRHPITSCRDHKLHAEGDRLAELASHACAGSTYASCMPSCQRVEQNEPHASSPCPSISLFFSRPVGRVRACVCCRGCFVPPLAHVCITDAHCARAVAHMRKQVRWFYQPFE